MSDHSGEKRKSGASGSGEGTPGKKRKSGASGSGEGACESPNNWKEFLYLSDSGRYDLSPSNKINYGHWLPSQPEELLEEGDLPDIYEEFDTLTHTTTMENAYSIFKNGFKPRPVNDSSVVNPSCDLMNADTRTTMTLRPMHPLRRSPVLWYGPNTFNKLKDPEFKVKRYGNVLFSMKRLWGYEGIMPDEGLQLYFVEVIKYKTSSACRFLVTEKTYPELKPYKPYIRGGPLYVQKKEKRGYTFYYASKIKWHDGEIVENVLEIMKEESNIDDRKRWCFNNHVISFFECVDPRKNVKSLVVPRGQSVDVMSSYLVPNILKLAIVISVIKSGDEMFPFRLLIPFDDNEERKQKFHDELETVHKRALQKLEGEKEDGIELVELTSRDIGFTSFMSKSDILLSYCDLLRVVSEPQRESLADEIWKKIQVYQTLADPKKY